MKYLPGILLLCLLIGSCKWDTDTEVPDLYVARPENGATLIAGEATPFEISAVDDQLLSEISFTLEPDFDSLWIEDRTLPGWRVNGDTSIMGNTFFWKGEWQVPAMISEGNYLLSCQVTDANGQGQEVDVPFKVDNPLDSLVPQIDSFSATDTVPAGQTWNVHVSVSDDLSLRYFTLQFMGDNEEIWRKVVGVNDTVIAWDSTFANPGTEGRYDLRLILRDWVNKTRTRTVGVVFQ